MRGRDRRKWKREIERENSNGVGWGLKGRQKSMNDREEKIMEGKKWKDVKNR